MDPRWCCLGLEAALAACLDGVCGYSSPGASKPRRDRRGAKRYDHLCVCIGHQDATAGGEWLDVNCGQRVSLRGQVRKWHNKAPHGYDHNSIVQASNDRETLRRQALVAVGRGRGHDPPGELSEDAFPLSNLDDIELSLTELNAEKARILREKWDALDPSRKISTYTYETTRLIIIYYVLTVSCT